MKKSRLRIFLLWLPVIALMAVIFVFSHQSGDGSRELSDSLLNDVFNIDATLLFTLIIRKLAHMLEYALLCFLSCNALKNSGDKRWAVSSVILTLFYACTDEVHQLLVPGRAGKTYDVVVDMAGAVVGLLIFKLILRYRSRKNGRNQTV
jgi:VanZ family protein